MLPLHGSSRIKASRLCLRLLPMHPEAAKLWAPLRIILIACFLTEYPRLQLHSLLRTGVVYRLASLEGMSRSFRSGHLHGQLILTATFPHLLLQIPAKIPVRCPERMWIQTKTTEVVQFTTQGPTPMFLRLHVCLQLHLWLLAELLRLPMRHVRSQWPKADVVPPPRRLDRRHSTGREMGILTTHLSLLHLAHMSRVSLLASPLPGSTNLKVMDSPPTFLPAALLHAQILAAQVLLATLSLSPAISMLGEGSCTTARL